MRTPRALIAGATIAALAIAPLVAEKAIAQPVHKARFAVTALGIVGSARTYDVTSAPAVIKFRVQVKDFDKKFDPASVKVVVAEKVSGTVTTFTVGARRVGHSRVVSNWLGTITVPAGSAPATYCLKVVKVDDTSTATLPVVATAKGLAGRDCFVVTNSTPPALPV